MGTWWSGYPASMQGWALTGPRGREPGRPEGQGNQRGMDLVVPCRARAQWGPRGGHLSGPMQSWVWLGLRGG
jgi:hypothetical protein